MRKDVVSFFFYNLNASVFNCKGTFAPDSFPLQEGELYYMQYVYFGKFPLIFLMHSVRNVVNMVVIRLADAFVDLV